MVCLSQKELKNKVLSLPYEPGVYLMMDKTGTIIYVGKAKKLKNRVSQYFQDASAHSSKTRMMVSKIANFDYIVARSEFEALVLEWLDYWDDDDYLKEVHTFKKEHAQEID